MIDGGLITSGGSRAPRAKLDNFLISGFARRVPTPSPSFSYSASSLAVPTGFTFTRASTGTFLGSNGLIQSAAIDTPRFEYNSAGVLQGLLIEESQTNTCRQSETFSTTWGLGGLSLSKTIAAPDGTNNATEVTTTSGAPILSQTISTAASAVPFTYSIFVNRGNTATIGSASAGFGAYNTTTAANIYFISYNYDTNTVTETINPGNGSTVVTQYPNGWRRLELTITGGVSVGNSFVVYAGYSGGAAPTSGLTYRIWGAQLDAGAAATSYIPTTTAAVTRAGDNLSAATSGLAWFSQAPYTVYTKWTVPGDAVNSSGLRLLHIGDGAATNRAELILNSSETATLSQVTANVAVAAIASAARTIGASSTLIGVFATDNFKYRSIETNGMNILTDTSGAMNTNSTVVRLGSYFNGTLQPNGYLQGFRFWNSALSNTQMQGLV